MIDIIQFKKEGMSYEFWNQIDSRLQLVLFALAGYIYTFTKHPLLITHLMRTQEEQDNIYLNSSEKEKYKESPWKSVHQDGRGADISVTHISSTFIKNIEDYFSGIIPYREARVKLYYDEPSKLSTAKNHNAGQGWHFHIQVEPGDYSLLKRISQPVLK